MNIANVAYCVRQAEALVAAAHRELERALRDADVDDAVPALVEPLRLRTDDAKRLVENVHYIVRIAEQLGAGVAP